MMDTGYLKVAGYFQLNCFVAISLKLDNLVLRRSRIAAPRVDKWPSAAKQIQSGVSVQSVTSEPGCFRIQSLRSPQNHPVLIDLVQFAD